MRSSEVLGEHTARKCRSIGPLGARALLIAFAFIIPTLFAAEEPADAPPATQPPLQGRWLNAKLTPDERAEAALAAMTREEKLALLHVPLAMMVPPAKRPDVPVGAGWIAGVPRLGIAPIAETDASLGVGNLLGMRRGDTATALPSSLALGASWDTELARRAGTMIGSEARAKGFGVMLAGGVNLVRDPRAGRNFEYVSEDPLLAGVLTGHAVAGIQSNRIVSTLKHLALNGQETGRYVYSVDMAEPAMRESDLLAFEIAQEVGQPGSIMCAYNRVNGVYSCESRFLLSEVLRGDWGFKGFVMSDWGATHSVGALQAGLDQQSGEQLDVKPFFGAELEKALMAGAIPQSAVDAAARRILRTLFAYGLVDAPPVAGGPIEEEAHRGVAQEVEEAGAVLLRNEDALLPLAGSTKRIALIGGHANIGVLSGAGSSIVVPLGGWALELRQKGEGLAPVFARSYGASVPFQALKAAFPAAQVDFIDGADPAAAAALAANVDVAIVFAEKWFREGTDSVDMSLGAGQDELIEQVARANPRTVIVLETGNPVAMPWREAVQAILVAWYPGQQGAQAIARILSGEVNPSGHLPMTWPVALEQLPLPKLPGSDVAVADKATKASYGMQADRMPFSFEYPEGSDAGYRWFDRTHATPLYAFGHGLSYTSFRLDNLKLSGGRSVVARFAITNTGVRSGATVAQVYAVRAGRAKRLIGWSRVQLAPGESRHVVVTADPRLLGDFDAERREWVIAEASYQIEVGTSAVDTVLSAIAQLKRRRISVSLAHHSS